VLPTPLTTPEALHKVPVVPIALPNPESFPFLMQFLYLKNIRQLFDMFLTLTPANGIPEDLDQQGQHDAFITEYSSTLAWNYTIQRLASQAVKVDGLWRNLTLQLLVSPTILLLASIISSIRTPKHLACLPSTVCHRLCTLP
jgi:hypothetical protein